MVAETSLSVLISSYGDERWAELARTRAYPSAEGQGAELVVVHQPEGTVSSSRNAAAAQAGGEWLCFLDADDELGPGFVQAMAVAAAHERTLYTPAVSYVINGRRRPSRFWPRMPLQRGNWLVISTLIHRSLFLEVGGFVDYGDPIGSNAYEDWALWSRCQKADALIQRVPQALLIVHQDLASRHRHADAQTKRGWHLEIGQDVWPEHYGADGPLPSLRLIRR